MGIQFRKEEKPDIILDNVIKTMSIRNGILYDYDLHKIIINNEFIGCLIEYKVPIVKSRYLDILVFPEYRNRGYGSTSLNLFIENNLSDCEEVYIKSTQNDKSIFLYKNGFEFIKENLYKDLFIKKTRKECLVC